MKAFAVAEKALLELCAAAQAAGDVRSHGLLTASLEQLRAAGGWQAFSTSQPVRSSNAERQARLRERRRNANAVTSGVTHSVTSPVTSGVTVDGEALLPTSLSSSSDLDKYREEEKKAAEREESARGVTPVTSRVTPKALRGTRCTPSYTPRDETVTALRAEGFPNPLGSLPSFRDYWTAKPGKDGCKLDWDATFRIWVRREKTMTPGPARTFGRSAMLQGAVGKDLGFVETE